MPITTTVKTTNKPIAQAPNYFSQVMGYFGLALAAATVGVFGGLYLLPKALLTNQGFFLAMSLLTLVLVWTAKRWSTARLGYLFLIFFAAIFGLTIVPLLLYVSLSGGILMIGKALLAAVAMFGGMALYGFTTRRDLSGLGSILFASLIGMIFVSLMTFILYLFGIQVWSNTLELIFAGVGILVFAGFTAFDLQRIRRRQIESPMLAAISLFLDFVLLFEYILRFMNGRKD